MNALSDSLISSLRSIFPPGDLYTDPADCWSYGYDNSRLQVLPSAVVFASDQEQIRALIALCNREGVPITPRGRGTGTTGATVPTQPGIVLSLERMNAITEVSPENRYIVVQPGVINQELQNTAAEHGFFWAPDPSSASFCTVGGNLAYNSAGPRAVKYGTPRENTLGLSAITGSGNTIRTGVYTSKGVVGYDLTRLLIGSEGTLAVICEAILKLIPLPQTKRTLRAVYSDLAGATQAIIQIMTQPTVPCALEFMDGNAVRLINRYSSIDLPGNTAALLLIEVDGNLETIGQSVANIEDAAATEELIEIRSAQSDQESAALWHARKALSPALRKVAPAKINEDIVVPVTQLPQLIQQLNQFADEHQLTIVNFGHAGNGNIHTNILFDSANPTESERALRCLDRVFDLVLQLKGTLSGEHGVGLVKRDYIAREIEPDTLQLMRNIKRQFDPNGILNPDKVFPEYQAQTPT